MDFRELREDAGAQVQNRREMREGLDWSSSNRYGG